MELTRDTVKLAFEHMYQEPLEADRIPGQRGNAETLNAHINAENAVAYSSFLRQVANNVPPLKIDDLPRLVPRLISFREANFIVSFLPKPEGDVASQKIVKATRRQIKANLQNLRTIVTRAILEEMGNVARVANIPLNPRIIMRAKSDAPVERKLTMAEIDSLISALPLPKTPDPLARAVIYAIERHKLRVRLEALKMVVTSANLEDLRLEIKVQYEMAMLEAGNIVGSHMDNTLAASITQTMFNTFGMVGKASTVGSGAQTMENLLYTVAERNDVAMSIHFRVPFTHRDVVELRYVFIKVSVADFLLKEDMRPKTELGVYVIPNRPDPSRLEATTKFETHEGYEKYEIDNDIYTGYPSHIVRGYEPGDSISKIRSEIEDAIDPDFVFDLVNDDNEILDFVPRYDIDTLTSTNGAYIEAFEVALKVFSKYTKNPKQAVFVRRDRDDPIRLAAARHLGVRIDAPWWHKIYARTIDEDFRYAHHVLRLHVDIQKLYDYGMTLNDLVDTLLPEDRNSNDVCADNEKLMKLDDAWYHVIASPTQYGYIDIIPRLSNDIEGDHTSYEDTSIIYLNRIVRPRLSGYKVRGIDGITSLTPVEIKYQTMFKSSESLGDGRWYLKLDEAYMRNNCIRDADIHRFLEECKFNDIEFEANVTQRIVIDTLAQMDIDVTPLENRIHSSGVFVSIGDSRTPDQVMTEAIDAEIAPKSYVYAVCTGSNLRDVIRFPWVDDTRTITNNIHEMCDTYGVEAARFYYLYEIAQVMADSGAKNTDFHNLLLLGDFIFGFGIPLGVKQNSLQKRGEGYLTMGLTEKLAETIKAAAAVGSTQSTRSMIASVFTGQWSRSGSFAYDVDHDPKSIEFIAAVIAEDKRLREYRKHPERFPGMRGPPAPEVPDSALEAVKDFEFGPVLLQKVGRRNFATQIEADAMLEDDLDVYPWLPVIPHPINTMNILSLPPWVVQILDRYEAQVSTKFLERKEPVDAHVRLIKAEATPLATPLYTYMRPEDGIDLYLPAWDAMLQSHGFQRTTPVYDHVDYLEIRDNRESYLGFADIKAKLINRISGPGIKSVINKGRLYVNMAAMFPEFTKLHMATTFSARHFDAEKFFRTPQDVAIVRHTGAKANTGFGVKVITSKVELDDFRKHILEEFGNDEEEVKENMGTMVVSRYITNPLLYQGRKFHLRMYVIHAVFATKNGFKRKTGLCTHGDVIAARDPYVFGQWENTRIHDTHGLDDEFILYPRALVEEIGQARVTNMHQQMEEIAEKIGELLTTTQPPPNSRNAYRVLGIDVMFTGDSDTAILIEANPSPGYALDIVDQFTHDRQIVSKSITDWIFNNVFGEIFNMERREAEILNEALGDYKKSESYNTINMGEVQYEVTPASVRSMTNYLQGLSANITKLRSIVNMGRNAIYGD